MKRLTGTVLVFFLILSFHNYKLFAQPDQKEPKNIVPILFEKNIVPNDSSNLCYISFRIPLNQLIFINKDNGYTGGIRLDFEFQNQDGIFDRASITKNIKVNTYDETKADNHYLQGLLSFELPKEQFYLIPYLTFTNTQQSIRLDSINFDLKKLLSNGISHPVVLENGENDCGGSLSHTLANYRNSIPFSDKSYFLIIPVSDSFLTKAKIVIDQENRTVFENELNANTGRIIIKECENNVLVTTDSTNHTGKYFIVRNISEKLYEGNVRFRFYNDGKEIKEIFMTVNWFDKPRSLADLKNAIGLLNLIEGEEKVKQILNGDDAEKGKRLREYWNRFDPDSSNAYNKLMAEFYNRADYAVENYGSILNGNGIKSDRGKIYIRFGKPDEIVRDYSEDEVVYEIWKYNDLKKEFLFKDETGLGNYILSN
ncbi:MAG: GWxTD domain-containing protein [Bacteroidota bacterium]